MTQQDKPVEQMTDEELVDAIMVGLGYRAKSEDDEDE